MIKPSKEFNFDDWIDETTVLAEIYYFFYRLFHKIGRIPIHIKWIFQKIFRGYSDNDLWALDYTLSKVILPYLKGFRKTNKMGYPMGMKGKMKEWHKTIDKMIWSFEQALEDHSYCPDYLWDKKMKNFKKDKLEEYNKKLQEGFDLFAKYFTNLWD